MSTPLKLDPTLQTPRPEPEMRPGPAKTPSEPKPEPKSSPKDSSASFGNAKQTLDLITDNAVGGAVSLASQLAANTKAAAPLAAVSAIASPLSVLTASTGLADAAARGDVEASLENGLSFAANTIGTAVAVMGEAALPSLHQAGAVIAAGVGGYSLAKGGDAYLRKQNGASPADLATTKAVQTHDGILKLTGSPVLAEAMGLHELGRGLIDAVVPTVTGGVMALGERALEATGLKKPRA